MKLLKYIVVFLGCLISTSAFTQDSVSIYRVVNKLELLRSKINAIATQNTTTRPFVQVSRDIINKSIIQFESKEELKESFVPAEYYNAIDYLSIMADSVKRRENTEQQLEFSKLLLKDLQLKFKPSNNGNLTSLGYEQHVKVNVIPKRDNKEVPGLQVHYAPLGFEVNYDLPYLSFKKLTSPAIEEIIPGFYVFWITEPLSKRMIASKMAEVDPSKNNIIEIGIK